MVTCEEFPHPTVGIFIPFSRTTTTTTNEREGEEQEKYQHLPKEDTSQDLVHKSDFILTFCIINSACPNTTDTEQSGTSIKTELARLGLVEQQRT